MEFRIRPSAFLAPTCKYARSYVARNLSSTTPLNP